MSRNRELGLSVITVATIVCCVGVLSLISNTVSSPSERATPMANAIEERPEAPTPFVGATISEAVVEGEEAIAGGPAISTTPGPAVTNEPPTSTPPPQLRVIYSSINLRAGPGTDHDSIGFLFQDDVVTMLGTSDNGLWYKVIVADGDAGWVAASVVELVDEASPINQTEMILAEGYSILELTNVVPKAGEVVISGVTDLPDGSELIVTFDITGYAPDEPWLGVQEKTQVTDGLFSVSIFPPDIPKYRTGPYEIEVHFETSPAQTDSVIALVGQYGENLTGDNVRRVQYLDYALNVMEISEQVDLELDLQSPTYPQIDVTLYPPDSPERAVAEYLAAWREQDWARMARFTQLTWRDDQDDPATYLRDQHGFFMKLVGSEIGGREAIDSETIGFYFEVLETLGIDTNQIEDISDVYVIIRVTVYYFSSTYGTKSLTISPTVIREAAPYRPSPIGDWGVNPESHPLWGD